jgi:hypothetical protein
MSLDFHTVFSFLFMYDVSVLPIVKFWAWKKRAAGSWEQNV